MYLANVSEIRYLVGPEMCAPTIRISPLKENANRCGIALFRNDSHSPFVGTDRDQCQQSASRYRCLLALMVTNLQRYILDRRPARPGGPVPVARSARWPGLPRVSALDPVQPHPAGASLLTPFGAVE